MGTLQFSEIKTEVRSAFANRTDVDSRLANVINMAQRRIARFPVNFRHLYNEYTYAIPYSGTAATDKVITLSNVFSTDPVRRIVSIRLVLGNGKSRKLERRTTRQWDREIPEPEYLAVGEPTKYLLLKSTLELWRVPAESYNSVWRTYNWPTPLSADGNTSDFDELDDLIIAYSLVYMANSFQMFEEAAKWRSYANELARESLKDSLDTDDLETLPRFESNQGQSFGDYYADPFIEGMP